MVAECEGKFYKVEIEDHYVVVGEPGCSYLSHVVPEEGSGVSIAEALYGVIKDTELEGSLDIVASDGTSVNTGK